MVIVKHNFFELDAERIASCNLVYSLLQPSKRHAYAQTGDNIFTPVERELIFDIVSYANGKTCDHE